MLDSTRLNVTIDVPDFLMCSGISNVEEAYGLWAEFWLEYSEDDWIGILVESLWHSCDDHRDNISRVNHIVSVLGEFKEELENHFTVVCEAITGKHLPNQIDVKPSGMRGVVLWCTS